MNINKNISTEEIFNKAIQYHINSELNLAKKIYKEVIKKNPNHIKALNNLGLLFKKAGEFEEAIAELFNLIFLIFAKSLEHMWSKI